VAVWVLGAFVVVNAFDVITSVLGNRREDMEESNPFARDAMHNFLLGRGLKVKFIVTVVTLAFAFVAYRALRHAIADRHLAQLLALLPIVYLTWDTLQTVLNNFLLLLGWYVG
jgi:hypothetical protein